ncbi:hypothetical protein TSUD_274680 [Trifolium subterraneum]|uniref:Uncharacterized protein n=1 Tax=Trifolium subterraneum TaxID=3900 RepID=A0A2Z6NIF5_TRISU|nr:hypothetical protein TSUD_274680 [Trifolium subterraneum]
MMGLKIKVTRTSCNPTREFIDNNAVRYHGLSMKSIFSVSLDFVSQARMRNSMFRLNLNPFLDEKKVLPMSVNENLDVESQEFNMILGPHCKFSPLAPNTLSSELSQTKPPWGGLLSMGCTVASSREEFAFCSHIHQPKRCNDIVVPSSLLATSILKLNLNLRNRPPEKPPYDDYRIEDQQG